MGLQMFPENRHWWCRRDVQRQSVPQSGSSDRKSSIADSWNTGSLDNKQWCERRCWRASSADDWWNSSARYGGADWCRHLYTYRYLYKYVHYYCMLTGVICKCNMAEDNKKDVETATTEHVCWIFVVMNDYLLIHFACLKFVGTYIFVPIDHYAFIINIDAISK